MTRPNALIVDDGAAMRRFLKVCLEEAGVDCIEAANGREALAQARNPISLVITDIQMGPIDGFELFNLIQAGALGVPPPPTIFCSSCIDEPSIVDRTELKRAAGLLPKPFQPREAIQLVRSILEKS